VIIRRLQLLRATQPGRVKVISDNPKHAAEEVTLSEIEIVGKALNARRNSARFRIRGRRVHRRERWRPRSAAPQAPKEKGLAHTPVRSGPKIVRLPPIANAGEGGLTGDHCDRRNRSRSARLDRFDLAGIGCSRSEKAGTAHLPRARSKILAAAETRDCPIWRAVSRSWIATSAARSRSRSMRHGP
jgi:hypothetical protein